jgi:predicted GH43/DUF377 family glycosyl hydrolase
MKKNALILFLLAAILVLSERQVFGQLLPWTKDANNPILTGGAEGTWNRHLNWPFMLYNTDSTRYEMWFSALVGPPAGWRPSRIGFATSQDGITWTIHPDPVLVPDTGTWDESTVQEAAIIRENGLYKMWYGGSSPSKGDISEIGYATSTDGKNWTKDTLNNPVLVPGSASWQAGGVSSPHVLAYEGGYKMWYTGWNADWTRSDIGYATSLDGISWTADTINNPVLTAGGSTQWDDSNIWHHQVVFIDTIYHMWYTGTNDPSTVDSRKIGWATSKDGILWAKNSNPVLGFGGVNEWDEDRVDIGTVRLEDDTLRMWYTGLRKPWGIGDNIMKIGHARAPFKGDIVGIEDYFISHIPDRYSLSQNYPNPFNPSTTIEFDLPKSSDVRIEVYNIKGQKVKTLVNEKMSPGNHQVEFNAQYLSSGVYFYRIEAAEFQQVRKMILLK